MTLTFYRKKSYRSREKCIHDIRNSCRYRERESMLEMFFSIKMLLSYLAKLMPNAECVQNSLEYMSTKKVCRLM